MILRQFGIEIRRIGGAKQLYEQVDATLVKHALKQGVSGNVQALATAHALQKMLKTESHFSICAIRDCADMCQIPIPIERMQVYQSAHCIGWNEMTPEYREVLVAMVLDDFRTVLNPAI